MKFSFAKLKSLFSFSWKLLFSGLLYTCYRQIYNLVIGKAFSSNELGLFNRGETFPSMVATNLDGSIQSVMLPTMSSQNDDKTKVKNVCRRSISVSAFIIMPFMFGMAAVAKPMVQVLLTDKWLSCVPFIQLACFSFALYPLHTANLTAINAVGRSDIFLKLEIIKTAIGVIVMLMSIRFGVMFMATSRILSGLICTFVNAHPNKKLLGYTYMELWCDILLSILISLVMGVFVYFMGFLSLPPFALLIVQIVVGVCIYVLLAKLFKLEVFAYFISTIKNMKQKRG